MADWRYFEPAFWDDDYILPLKYKEKFVYSYLFTNPYCNQAGLYKLPIQIMMIETGLPDEEIRTILKKFEKDKKVELFDGLIWVKNFLKHQPNKNPSVWKRIIKDVQRMEMHSRGLMRRYIDHIKTLPIPYPEDVDSMLTGCRQGVDRAIRKEKEKEEDKEKESTSSPKLKFTDEDMKLVKELETLIKEVDPKHRFAGGRRREKWANTFRLMRRQDHRTIEDIRAVMEAAFGDSFWSTVIQSADGFREHYNQLRAKMLGGKGNGKEAERSAPYH